MTRETWHEWQEGLTAERVKLSRSRDAISKTTICKRMKFTSEIRNDTIFFVAIDDAMKTLKVYLWSAEIVLVNELNIRLMCLTPTLP